MMIMIDKASCRPIWYTRVKHFPLAGKRVSASLPRVYGNWPVLTPRDILAGNSALRLLSTPCQLSALDDTLISFVILAASAHSSLASSSRIMSSEIIETEMLNVNYTVLLILMILAKVMPTLIPKLLSITSAFFPALKMVKSISA